MSDQIVTGAKETTADNSSAAAVEPKDAQPACQIQAKGWLKGGLAMAVCCAAPFLLLAAVTFLGISLGTLASRVFSIAALLACPVGMYFMMQMMMKDKNK